MCQMCLCFVDGVCLCLACTLSVVLSVCSAFHHTHAQKIWFCRITKNPILSKVTATQPHGMQTHRPNTDIIIIAVAVFQSDASQSLGRRTDSICGYEVPRFVVPWHMNHGERNRDALDLCCVCLGVKLSNRSKPPRPLVRFSICY